MSGSVECRSDCRLQVLLTGEDCGNVGSPVHESPSTQLSRVATRSSSG